MEKIWRAY